MCIQKAIHCRAKRLSIQYSEQCGWYDLNSHSDWRDPKVMWKNSNNVQKPHGQYIDFTSDDD